jgi:hypothetical protein
MEVSMPIEQSLKLIMLYRLRQRARKLITANQNVGNRAVAYIYGDIDNWLEGLMTRASLSGH